MDGWTVPEVTGDFDLNRCTTQLGRQIEGFCRLAVSNEDEDAGLACAHAMSSADNAGQGHQPGGVLVQDLIDRSIGQSSPHS